MTPGYFIADDLSGVLDAAGAFHHAGWPVTLALSPEEWPDVDGHIIGITTETRNAAPEVAARIVTETIAMGEARGMRLLYKKIDSTLRGPVAAEVAAVAKTLPEARLLFCPANPAVGRTVEAGVLRVHGVPVAETEFGQDPASPVKESVIARVLGPAASGHVDIADAATEEDLASAVARMEAAGGNWIAVGSGALARHVAARYAKRRPAIVNSAQKASGPCLLICGSAHAKNREQAAALVQVEEVDLLELRFNDAASLVAISTKELRAGRSVAILVEARRHADSREVVQAVAATAAAILDAVDVQRIFVTGGETAFALCRQLEVNSLSFVDELEPGLSLSVAKTPRGKLMFAIKPGGFGDRQTWIRAWAGLRDDVSSL
jgi:uncharacterized protein YgbK (DUF1537 family)